MIAETIMVAVAALTMETYGVPLDCRKPYTKADWLIWCGALTGRRADLAFMADGIYRFLDETPDRVPYTDWYMADPRLFRGFKARNRPSALA